MTFYTTTTRDTRRSNPGRCHRAHFARQATIAAFGWRFAKALDQANFVDRRPGDRVLPKPWPGGWGFAK